MSVRTGLGLLSGLVAVVALGSCSDTGGPSTPYPYDLLYITGPDGNFDIHRIHLDGTGDTTLTSSIADDYQPATTAGDPRIVFVSKRTNQAELYLMNPDGTNQVPLTADTNNLLASTFRPSWKTDGSRIVYLRPDNNGNTVMSMNPDGTDRVALTAPGDTGVYDTPQYSPDGSKIVLWRFPLDSASGIFTMSSNGSNITRLTTATLGDVEPCWSPDGTRIAFSRTVPDTFPPDYRQGKFWIMNADGSSQHRLLASADSVDDQISGCTWSPDGSMIAVVHGNKIATIRTGDLSVHDLVEGVDPAWIPRETAARR